MATKIYDLATKLFPLVASWLSNEKVNFKPCCILMEKMSAEELRMKIYEDGESVLDLSDTGLSNVPEGVFDLTELKKLDLSDNYLKELLKSINKLKNLKTLRLNR